MSSSNKTFLLVSYDIREDARRTRVARQLQDYGQRVQFSVFECFLNKEEYSEMLNKVKKYIDMDKDNLRIYKICGTCCRRIESYGIGRGWREGDDEQIIVI